MAVAPPIAVAVAPPIAVAVAPPIAPAVAPPTGFLIPLVVLLLSHTHPKPVSHHPWLFEMIHKQNDSYFDPGHRSDREQILLQCDRLRIGPNWIKDYLESVNLYRFRTIDTYVGIGGPFGGLKMCSMRRPAPRVYSV